MTKEFILDENMSDRHANLLELCFKNINARSIKRKLHATGTKDTVWMRELAGHRPKPIIVTCDKKLKTRPLELQALRESGLTYLVLLPSWMDVKFPEQAWRLVKVWPKVQKLVDGLDDGQTIFEIDILAGTVIQL